MDGNSISQWIGNVVGAGAVIGTMLGYFAPIAALVALIWYLIQIYESATLQRWLANRRAHKIARLKAKIVWLQAKSAQPDLAETFGPKED